jgi:hypothetical protein
MTRNDDEETTLISHGPPTPSHDLRWGVGKSLLVVVVILAASCASLLAVNLSAAAAAASLPNSHNEVDADANGQVPSLGSKNGKKKNDKEKNDYDDDEGHCNDGGYSKRTLKLAYELPFASLFRNHKGQKKYEASSVIMVDDDVYAVCDSSWAISKFGSQLQPFANGNVQVGDPRRDPTEESGYEALFHDDGTFYIVRESIQHDDATYHAVIEELKMVHDDNDSSSSSREEVDYVVDEICSCDYEFEGDSKGFEGAIAIRDLNNELVILGLCEGNYCSESRKNERGNGRLVAMRKTLTTATATTSTGAADDNDGGENRTVCHWTTIREIQIPSSAYFRDYSALTMNSEGRVAISSQEESQIWIGQVKGQREDGLWDVDSMEFSPHDKQVVYDFPKNDQCATIYCNIEGVHWINDDMIIAVSDKMKSKGKQDFRCFDKDQSVHVFVLP